jgi:arsenate reductase
MAEAIWNYLADGEWKADSAGSRPTGFVHPLATKALQEYGLDATTQTSKSVEQFAEDEFDLVVTVCDHARDSCPHFTGAKQMFHWPLPDPGDAVGSDEERMAVFRQVRDQIRQLIQTYLELTHKTGSLGKLTGW